MKLDVRAARRPKGDAKDACGRSGERAVRLRRPNQRLATPCDFDTATVSPPPSPSPQPPEAGLALASLARLVAAVAAARDSEHEQHQGRKQIVQKRMARDIH